VALKSRLFRGDAKLEAAATSDPAHVVTGTAGEHVGKLQSALGFLDRAAIDAKELNAHAYGATTAAAVLAYKRKRNIVNRAYQKQPDNIVGKMTIAALDQEMVAFETAQPAQVCNRTENGPANPNGIPRLV
jgi:hypothetical protein